MGMGLALPRSMCTRMGERSMMDILSFIFSSFWIFLGTACLLATVFNGVAAIICAWRHGK